jgi:hypothetical protein
MKIKNIKISGFRGIPPGSPPNVDINLAVADEIKDFLLFGPNAYGKSSIADALEWFFKENVRCSSYFDDYCDQDNVHLNIGKPNYPQNAFIELIIVENGTDYVVRKELTPDGKKSSEDFGALRSLFERIKDEVIVLDHDQFRNFVSAANKEKWETFASLIGYQELDFFRNGFDSLTQRSLTEHLRLKALNDDIDQKEMRFESYLRDLQSEFNCSVSSFEELKRHLNSISETLSLSLSIDIPGLNQIAAEDCDVLEDKVKPSPEIGQAATYLSNLKTKRTQLRPFADELFSDLKSLQEELSKLAVNKNIFDKEIISEFYKLGLDIVDQNLSDIDRCPFCKSPYPWKDLKNHVREHLAQLNIAEINSAHQSIMTVWEKIRLEIESRRNDFREIGFDDIEFAYQAISDLSAVQRALSLSEFDEQRVIIWVGKVKVLNDQLEKKCSVLDLELKELETSASNPQADLQAKVYHLKQAWRTIKDLEQLEVEIDTSKKRLDITQNIIDSLRGASRDFRNELSDFSGRVTEEINADVQTYYEELHPGDDVVPRLDTSVSGKQRIVRLTCSYKGVPGRTATALLSESHRNSLGMSILLAFMKYKQKLGSPLEFIVLMM